MIKHVFPAVGIVIFLVIPTHLLGAASSTENTLKDKLPVLLDGMASSDTKVAGTAAIAILKQADEINVSIVRGAMARVGALQDWRAFPSLIEILQEKNQGQYHFDPDTRSLCALNIGNIFGNRGFEPAKEDKEETDPLFSGENTVQALLAVLSPQEDIRVRMASAQALGKSCSPTPFPPLKAIVNNPQENPVLQVFAVRSLTRLYNCLVARGLTPPDPPGDPSPYPHLTTDMVDRASAWALQFSNLLAIVPTKSDLER